MALIACPECGKEISDKAAACIGCGCPVEKQAGRGQAEQILTTAINPEPMPPEYWIDLSNFWKNKKGRFRAYEDRIVFSKMHCIFGFLPTEIKEYSILISDLQGISITTPEKLNSGLIGGLFTIICGMILFLFSLISLFVQVPLGIVFMPLAVYLVPLGRFNMVESTNVILKIAARTLVPADRIAYVAKHEEKTLRKFSEDINRLQARDANYILRNPNNSPNITLDVTRK